MYFPFSGGSEFLAGSWIRISSPLPASAVQCAFQLRPVPAPLCHATAAVAAVRRPRAVMAPQSGGTLGCCPHGAHFDVTEDGEMARLAVPGGVCMVVSTQCARPLVRVPSRTLEWKSGPACLALSLCDSATVRPGSSPCVGSQVEAASVLGSQCAVRSQDGPAGRGGAGRGRITIGTSSMLHRLGPRG